MSERYTGSNGGKSMSRRERRKYIQSLINSFHHADRIKQKLEKQKQQESIAADDTLKAELGELDTLSS